MGIDQEFIGLHLAKNFVAPGADYVCCVADGPLPFPDGFFSVAFCSDAFHYFENKVTSATELKRLTQEEGLVVSVWMHNVLWRRPYDGLPLPAEGYQLLFADMPHRLVADSEVLVRYLQKKGPALACSTDIDRLAREPLLSIVASHRQEFFREYGSFEEWPHVEGRLNLNPLYVEEKQSPAGGVKLRRAFPSAFYREEHPQCEEYLPESVTVDSQVLVDLALGTRTPAIDGFDRTARRVGHARALSVSQPPPVRRQRPLPIIRRLTMKTIILAGGLGSRLSEETTYGRSRWWKSVASRSCGIL